MDRGTVRRIMVGQLLRTSMKFSSGVVLVIEVMGKSIVSPPPFLLTNCGSPRKEQLGAKFHFRRKSLVVLAEILTKLPMNQ